MHSETASDFSKKNKHTFVEITLKKATTKNEIKFIWNERIYYYYSIIRIDHKIASFIIVELIK